MLLLIYNILLRISYKKGKNNLKNYRQGVAAVIVNSNKQIMLFERINKKDAWQIPQGGIDNNEDENEALFRELKEEIGTGNINIIGSTQKKYRYRFPLLRQLLFKFKIIKYRGQEHRYFLISLKDEAEVHVNTEKPEFKEYKWSSIEFLLNQIVKFKKKAYNDAINELKLNFPNYI